jgi:hypothetical protein
MRAAKWIYALQSPCPAIAVTVCRDLCRENLPATPHLPRKSKAESYAGSATLGVEMHDALGNLVLSSFILHHSSLILRPVAFKSKSLPQMLPSRHSQLRSKPSRKRSLQACLTCRSRKVRCDVSIHGQPCTNCSLDDKQCRLSSGATFLSVMIPPSSVLLGVLLTHLQQQSGSLRKTRITSCKRFQHLQN